jgi:ABC-type transport system involved in multi-copper enzyme maturation permease subunit
MSKATAIFRVGYGQLLGARRSWPLGALALLPAVVMYAGSSTMTDDRAFRFLHEGPFIVLLVAVAPIAALVLATSALGEERRQGTVSFLAIRPMPRWLIVAAKGAAAWAAIFTVVGAGGAATVAAYATRTGDWDPLLPMLLMLAINSLLYAALFVPLGFLFKRAVLFGLGYVFIWDNGIAGVPGLSPMSVFRVGMSAYVGLLPESAGLLDEPLGSVAPGAGGAAAKALVIAAIGVAALTTVFRRRDLV